MGRTESTHQSNVVALQKSDLTEADLEWIRSSLSFWVPDNDRPLLAFNEDATRMVIPRGAYRKSPIEKRIGSEVQDWRSTAHVSFPEPKMQLRPYQQIPASKLIKKGYGVLQAPTGSGKTIMLLWVIGQLAQRTLILVHTKELLYQWVERCEQMYGFTPGIIGDGQFVERDITIATVQSIARMGDLTPEWSESWGCCILDECHRCPAVSFADVVQQMTARYVFGASATPTRRDGMEPLLYAIIGPVVASIKEDDLVAAGTIIKPTVEMIPTDFWCTAAAAMDISSNQYQRQHHYRALTQKLVEDYDRSRLIVERLVPHANDHVLVLSDRIGHLEDMEHMLYELLPEARSAVITGKLRSSEREELLQRMREGDLNYLFATSLADEGLDVPILDVLALTYPGRGIEKLTQKVGRIMRTADGKKGALVLDFVDERVGALRGQAAARYNYYAREKECQMIGWIPQAASLKRAQAKSKILARKRATQ